MTDDFNNSRPLSYMEDEMYHQDNSIKRMHDDFLENSDNLSMSQKKKLAVVYNQIADELENERKFG